MAQIGRTAERQGKLGTEARRSRQRRRKTWIARPSFRSSIDSNPTGPIAQPRSCGIECSRAVVVVLTIE